MLQTKSVVSPGSQLAENTCVGPLSSTVPTNMIGADVIDFESYSNSTSNSRLSTAALAAAATDRANSAEGIGIDRTSASRETTISQSGGKGSGKGKSVNTNNSNNPENRHLCKEGFPQPSFCLQVCFGLPIFLSFLIWSYMPFLFILLIVFYENGGDYPSRFSSFSAALAWWSTTNRVGMFYFLRFSLRTFVPWFRILGAAFIKYFLIGPFSPRLDENAYYCVTSSFIYIP